MKLFQKALSFSFIMLILAISSCTVSGTKPVSTIMPSSVASKVVATALSPIVEFTPTLENHTIELSLEAGCVPIENEIPEDLSFSGSWIRNERTPYLENLNEGTTYEVPLENNTFLSTQRGDMAISPDGKYLAYIDMYENPVRNGMEKRTLRIIKSSGHVLPTDYWGVDWQWIIGWVDNRNLALVTKEKEITILNPFIGDWKTFTNPTWLSTETRDYYFKGNSYKYFPDYVYSPTLNWLVVNPDYNTTEIHDAQSGDLVWQGDSGDPLWSRDGKTLGFATNKKIVAISPDGKISQFQLNSFDADYSTDASMSPDGTKFVIFAYPDNYVVVNTEKRIIKRVCLDGHGIASYYFSAAWSPDSQYVIQSFRNFDLLIDMERMRSYKLVSGQYQHRLVWLASP